MAELSAAQWAYPLAARKELALLVGAKDIRTSIGHATQLRLGGSA